MHVRAKHTNVYTQGGIDLEDAIDIRRIKNLKLANDVLKQKRKKKQKRRSS